MGIDKSRDSSLVATALDSKRRMLCATPRYLAKHPAPRVLSDLAQHQYITTTELQPWTFQTGQQERTLRVADRLTVNSFEGIHDACMAAPALRCCRAGTRRNTCNRAAWSPLRWRMRSPRSWRYGRCTQRGGRCCLR